MVGQHPLQRPRSSSLPCSPNLLTPPGCFHVAGPHNSSGPCSRIILRPSPFTSSPILYFLLFPPCQASQLLMMSFFSHRLMFLFMFIFLHSLFFFFFFFPPCRPWKFLSLSSPHSASSSVIFYSLYFHFLFVTAFTVSFTKIFYFYFLFFACLSSFPFCLRQSFAYRLLFSYFQFRISQIFRHCFKGKKIILLL